MNDGYRLAVIGVGYLGRHHARILSALDGVSLTGVVDVLPDRAAEVAAATGATAFTESRQVLDKVDAVTVAVPTELHRDIALPFLERGISVMVEKPLARSLAEADELNAAARASGATLAVGHTERYNPAVAAVLPLVTTPRFIEVHRLGVFPERSLDIAVVFDLMIHDLDIILARVRSEVASIEAVGVPVLTPRYDIANARLRFASGCIANVTASRVSLKVSLQWLYENEPALESGLDVIALVELINPDGIAGSGDEFFRTVSSGGSKLVLGSADARKDKLDTIFKTAIVLKF